MDQWSNGDESSTHGFPRSLSLLSDSEEEDDVFEPVSYEIKSPSQSKIPGLRVFKEVDHRNAFQTNRRGCPASTSNAIQTENQPENMFHKTILVGDSGVGKTSLLVQFDTGQFHPSSFAATVGIGFMNKVLTVDGTEIKLQIWDTAGQERFRSVTHAYYRDAHALFLLYDVTNRKSYDNTRAWLAEINEYAHRDVIIMLLGNKFDSADRAVSEEEGIRLAQEYRVNFMETSAKTGLNVNQAFIEVAKALIDKQSTITDDTYRVKEYIQSEDWETSEKRSCFCNAT